MPQIWYTSEEVRDFHPHVKLALENAIASLGKTNEIEVKHHGTIPGTTTEFDFALRLKSTSHYILIVEVKRTKAAVNSGRFADQARSYATNLAPNWETTYHPYFVLTNIERSAFFCDRNGTISSCVLAGSPIDHADFDPITHDATTAIQNFEQSITQFLAAVFSKAIPIWNDEWSGIIDVFVREHQSVKNRLSFDEITNRELSLFEFLRLTLYSFLDRYYQYKNSTNQSFFHQLPRSTRLSLFKSDLEHNFQSILNLDFKQVFENHPANTKRIFPEHINTAIHANFLSLIQALRINAPNAIIQNSSPTYFFNLLQTKIYDKSELHKEGKIMSDSELANMLSYLLIQNHSVNVIDPCSGDAAFLDSSYDRLSILASSNGTILTHNDILSQLHGIEIDPFLAQMGTFRMISKNLLDVNTSTEIDIKKADMFTVVENNQYDVLLMNPPFLRNESLTTAQKAVMNNAIRAIDTHFFESARQPNLYYYFLNYSWHFLKNDGRGGVLLMEKFLNNQDGRCLREWISDKAEAIITYPADYFSDFRVTTVLVILNKALDKKNNLKVVNVKDTYAIENPNIIESALQSATPFSNSQINLRIIDRQHLIPTDNWILYTIPEQTIDKYLEQIQTNLFIPVQAMFSEISRGNAESQGGANIIFDDSTNTVHNGIESQFIGPGLKNSRVQRHYELSVSDLNIDTAVHLPAIHDNSATGLSNIYHSNIGLLAFYQANQSSSWKKIINAAFNNKLNVDILIPRGNRTKHAVYYNPHQIDVVISTNFAYLNGLLNNTTTISQTDQLKFITAFLLSSFGQLQLELQSNNQEGMRKLEVFQLERLRIPDPSNISQPEVDKVNTEFGALSNLNTSFLGDEGLNGPRRNLDMEIATILFNDDPLGFSTINGYVDFFETMLSNIIRERRN